MSKVWIFVFLGIGGALGQGRVAAPVRAVDTVAAGAASALGEMAGRAGVIFSGQVASVERHDEAGYVDVRFKVEDAVKGCAAGRPYVLREWAGLWSGAGPRYVAGERVLMLLTARGPGGMSAPLDGFAGVIPVRAVAVAPVADAQGKAPAEDGVQAANAGGMTADLRWVEAMQARTVRQADAVRTGLLAVDEAAGWVGPVARMAGDGEAEAPRVRAVVAVLRQGAGTK